MCVLGSAPCRVSVCVRARLCSTPHLHIYNIQEEYGREYYDKVTEGRKRAIQPIMWKSHNVTHALLHAVTAERQRPYVVVGMDGRFMMSPLLLLPRRCVVCERGTDDPIAHSFISIQFGQQGLQRHIRPHPALQPPARGAAAQSPARGGGDDGAVK